MRTATRVRRTCRDIIRGYAFHVRDKIKEKDVRYVALGIDNTMDAYESLFFAVLRKHLGLRQKLEHSIFPDDVIDECVGVLDIIVEEKNYNVVVKKYSEVVYETCLLIFRKVEEGLRHDGTL